MTISYPLAVPASLRTAKLTMRQRTVVGESISPFTAEAQTYVHQGQWWEMDVSVPPMRLADAEDLLSVFIALNGKEGTILLPSPNRVARGVASGTPVVDGASQSGRVLAIRGCTANISNWMKPGDWIQLGSGSSTRLHKVLVAVNTDSSGKAVLDIWPTLRYSPANGATIVVSAAQGLWKLTSNTLEYTIQRAMLYGYNFAVKESL